ncbi:hypothetical protein CHRY9390_00685 [Chryseobacterium aquaeductus]|uniref:Uncharacterized protein n=1 Tax=Chryseobacterium aquaeductus TaxID=2675056 RepID=A0A9N8MG32_9FLAO|nr:hypothetical protein [Chryseobacterium aquaeductus]CAA7330036.1 hypothetical protein CHRY9390_00685 [Chryseobacterium potabilaquae]CAD7800823.1 hypothetical protein CHRY9390_00685 [Chryseobacterium aquaeductus]
MKKYTKHLFIFSFCMSLVSLVLIEKGHKEMFPFASWKLFTVPSGGALEEERYVLYGVKNSDTAKINFTPLKNYESNDQAVITDTYGKNIENNDTREISRKKLLIFAKDIAPNYDGYVLYKEIYNPKEIGGKKMNINKKLITKL